MPRQRRIEYPGAIYHAMNRGDRREPIFQDDVDRRRFLQTLGEACAKTDWQLHALHLGTWTHVANRRSTAISQPTHQTELTLCQK